MIEQVVSPIDNKISPYGAQGLVSVVIPTYNRDYIIGKTVDSILAQTYPNIETIVIDDGSTDGTAALIARYGNKVRYLYQENAGVSAARNKGLNAATGEYIAFLDSDDTWIPWKIAAQVALLRAFPEVGMVWTDMVAVDDSGEVFHPKYLRQFYSAYSHIDFHNVFRDAGRLGHLCSEVPKEAVGATVWVGNIFPHMLMGNLVHTSTTLLTRERLRATGHFNAELKHSGEDYDFHLRTSRHGPVALLDTPTIHYRVGGEDQLTRPELDVYMARNNLATIRHWIELCQEHEMPPQILRNRLAQAHSWIGQAELSVGNRLEAQKSFIESLRYKLTGETLFEFFLSLLPIPALATLRRAKKLALRILPNISFGLRKHQKNV